MMKRFNLRYLLLAVLPIALLSCEDETLVVLNPSATIDPTVSATEIVLVDENAAATALTVSWPKPDYGFQAAPAYVVHLEKENGDKGEVAVNIGSELTKSFTVEELNAHLLKLGFEPEVASNLIIKVESRLGAKSIFAPAETVAATAYAAFLDLSTTWGVVGSAVNNWGEWPDAPFFTTPTAGVLVAYVNLKAGALKFRENNLWDKNYGDTGADGTLESGGTDIAVANPGSYKITFNQNTLTYTMVPYSWGIVGDAYNNWGADGPDYPFTYDEFTNQWRALVQLKAGKWKIRLNNDWPSNYGAGDSEGTLEAGGGDIVATAGKYWITWSEEKLTYSIEPVDHIWGLVGSAYNNWGADGPDAVFMPDVKNDGIYYLKYITLKAGAFKVRDANDWGLNYGDTGFDFTLEENGTDIPVAAAGVYSITLDFSNPASPTWEWTPQ
jgi:starch-binding outer membrane protein SusE/F